MPSGYYKAFVELHIEQGPLLERERIPLGIVTKIAAPASARITIEGAGGHAGGVLMPDRRDALCAAAELILAIENAARTSGSSDTVATVGMCDVFPGAVNSIPSRVRLSLDIRDTDLARRDSVMKTIEEAVAKYRRRAPCFDSRGTVERRCARPIAPPEVVEAIAKACETHQLKFLSHDQPRLSRFAFYFANRSHGDVVHPLLQWIQPSPGRIRVHRGYFARRHWCLPKRWRVCQPDRTSAIDVAVADLV